MGKSKKAPAPAPADYSEIERQKELQLEEADALKRQTRAKRRNLTKRGLSLTGSLSNIGG